MLVHMQLKVTILMYILESNKNLSLHFNWNPLRKHANAKYSFLLSFKNKKVSIEFLYIRKIGISTLNFMLS